MLFLTHYHSVSFSFSNRRPSAYLKLPLKGRLLKGGRFKLSTISQLKITDQKFITSDKEILAECETFYKELYTSQENGENIRLIDNIINYASQQNIPGLLLLVGV